MARILVIDDEADIRAILKRMLEKAGHIVIDAPDGRVGLRLFRENPADLVITDLIMPDMEGIETIMELRRDFGDVKIIAISGGGRAGVDTYLSLAAKLGAKRTLLKPLNYQDIISAVREVLGS